MQIGHGMTLLLGGARSGKSDLAVQLAHAWSGPVSFIATATAGDADMAARIARHKTDRPAEWSLVEAPLFAAADITAIDDSSFIIVDCITMLVSNLMFETDSQARADESSLLETQILDHVSALSDALASRPAPSLVVSNEVGLGIHPETELGRQYRDILGRVNRAIASRSETAAFVVAGKALPLETISFGAP